MTDRLDDLATSHGIQTRYVSEMGEAQAIEDEAKHALLAVLGVDGKAGDPGDFGSSQQVPDHRCAMPESLSGKRSWGITCQLYALRSDRTLGIGDFADLARLAEIGGTVGAAFVGVNPLHALFLADPGRYSPYSPSTRRFLNPFYIAVDALDGGAAAIEALRVEDPSLFENLGGDLVDYAAAGALKARLLRTLFETAKASLDADAAFAEFTEKGGAPLHGFALFEAISAAMVAEGGSAGWHNWPEAFHKRDGDEVLAFERENAEAVRFHEWLQYVADGQLAEAQRRARAAGMPIGLYLDFAVGVSPDGAETWADPALTVRDARVGSPPDMFNSDGQDWGLAPLSPRALAERQYRPLSEAYDALMEHAGAVRIDHAMGLARLWWIPEGARSGGGGYMR